MVLEVQIFQNLNHGLAI